MVRVPRLLEEEAIYHVTCRGNNKTKIFFVTYDYKRYLSNVQRYKVKYKFAIYAYTLMTNHVHMLIKPKLPKQLPRIMSALNVSYAMWHNRRYERVGHLWQGRYSSRIIIDEGDLLNCMAYIEMNPVKAGVKKDPESYIWCSYYERLKDASRNIIDFHPGYMDLGDTKEERSLRYRGLLSRTGS